MKYICRC